MMSSDKIYPFHDEDDDDDFYNEVESKRFRKLNGSFVQAESSGKCGIIGKQVSINSFLENNVDKKQKVMFKSKDLDEIDNAIPFSPTGVSDSSLSPRSNDDLILNTNTRSIVTIEALIDYLTKHPDDCISSNKDCNIKTHSDILTDFEDLTSKLLSGHVDPELHRIFKSHGWTGARYRFSHVWTSVSTLLLQDLSNYYLKKKIASLSSPYISMGMKSAADSSRRVSNEVISFIPDCLLTYLKNHSSLNTTEDGIQSFTFTGACMLPDISGFSKFSGEMCSKGVSGLDELRESINGFLGHIVETVYEYDGDGKNVIHSSYHE